MYLFFSSYLHWTLDPLVPDSISTGKWFIWVVTSWTIATTSSQVITDTIFSDMDAYYLLEMKSHITKWMLYLLNVIPTMSTYGTLILNLLPTSYVTRTISSSDVAISNVCKYSGTRFAPIIVPNSASSVCRTTFLLVTHVCHVLYCNMPLYIVACYCVLCYCMYVCISTVCYRAGTYVVIVTVFTVQLSI